MTKYTTVAAAHAAIAGHPGKKNASCIVACRMRTHPPGEMFYVISLSNIDTLRYIQRESRMLTDIEFSEVALDLSAPVITGKEKSALCKTARTQISSAEYGDPIGERAAAEKCLQILESGGTVADAKSALNEREPHPGWI
ncbi:MAG: hypothetical protein OXI23_18450 [Gemmatimonadota bacterium]|nr:hypothetical protein [Gemmatimonadota bacterium]